MILYKVINELHRFTAHYIVLSDSLYYLYGNESWTRSVYEDIQELYRVETRDKNTVEEIPLNECEQSLQERVYEFLLSR